jgi:YidC/Oxa1 family membrane protein insertase
MAVKRDGKRQQFTATLIRRPLEIMRPELDTKPLDFVAAGKHDPFSMLLTLQTLDAAGLVAPEKGGPGEELPGLKLWTTPWEVADQSADHVTFRKPVTGTSLVIEKQFRLAKAENATQQQSITSPVFHMDVQVRITNNGQTPHTVAYQLDGPNGLPAEGAWYATKVSRNWSSAGLRDVIVRFVGQPTTEVGCHTIAKHEFSAWPESPLEYIAVDAQYFSAAMIPLKKQVDDSWFSDTRPLLVGEVPKEASNLKMTNVSFRLTSKPEELTEGKSLKHEYRLFMGPKRPALLEQYATVPPNPAHPITLEDLVYYGWFGWVAKPMLWVLHGFYDVVMNYGIAIILLTVLVRGAMFPISRKQAIAAQKMQELQPQIKAIAEKYKSNPQERQHAQMELFRKHNYNPFAGCLPIFIQMPIFIGLYRSLMVDVELRDAPLISEWIRWCSNLAAPDMLFDWSRFMPDFVNSGQGFFGLGPYFNILPIFTVLLFLWQQKMFMPPPTDEQTAMQQKMMQYMMVFMGLMFFKVASGLCLYFIASSLWGITERKLLPKTLPKNPSGEPAAAPQISSGNGNNKSPKQKRKQRN